MKQNLYSERRSDLMRLTEKQLDLLISWGKFVKFNDVNTEEDDELLQMIINERYKENNPFLPLDNFK
jgi:hypothetical protein